MPKRYLETLEPSDPTGGSPPTGAPPRPVLPSGSLRPATLQHEPSSAKSPGVERLNPPSVRKATGPRTAHGKERSKRNALKHGLLSKALLLKNESRVEFASLHDGLRESLDPQGRLENELVENLAAILWRKRRLLQAERAEISKADVLRQEAPITHLVQRLNYVLPEGPLIGKPGNRSNLSVLREAMDFVEKYRLLLEADEGEDLDQVRRINFGPLPEEAADLERHARELREILRLIPASPREEKDGPDPAQSNDKCHKLVVGALEAEFNRLSDLYQVQASIEFRKAQSNFGAARIPSQDAFDRLLRYEAHLSREFDRTLTHLERLQRMRKGQPVPPPLRLEVSS